MPDERTGSTLTWLNSPLRANQNARTLIDMIQIGQYYRTDSKKAVRRKECYRPVVKFRDMDKELLQATVLGNESTTPGNSNSSGPDYYPPGDPESDGESEDEVISQPEDFDADMLLIPIDKDQWHDGLVETNLLTDEDVSLDNGALRDLLAIEPVTSVASHSKPRTVVKTVVDMSTTEINWDF
ncbi:hypothetical protein JVT61DRAFT_10080 [Boletus reticuloceps]|uniref:Uncharacterized protein n=1 Tax=Boletus reticuloceps TaxID=495285 RepID=A0A8I3ABT8_9AGAM|nr:hypothetical protein JVT61DRAFT_10080 [Boletus reticuloceps]